MAQMVNNLPVMQETWVQSLYFKYLTSNPLIFFFIIKENRRWFVYSYVKSNSQKTLYALYLCLFTHDNFIVYEHTFLLLYVD